MAHRRSSTKGFKQTSSLLTSRIRDASESRGFSQSRILTHWEEIAGHEIARIAHPVNIYYSKHGFGATLTVLSTGANAPMLEMEKEKIRTKVNAVYGYNAITRIKITQTAAHGFAEAQAAFSLKSKPTDKALEPEVLAEARKLVGSVKDPTFAQALEELARNVLSKSDYKSTP
jgi:hypothetical protein